MECSCRYCESIRLAEFMARNSCNRHNDCRAAKAKAEAAGRNPYNICCYDEDCEDCFGK